MFWSAEQFYDQKLLKTQKSTNNPMSNFGLIEENMELSHIHLAVQVLICQNNSFYHQLSQNNTVERKYLKSFNLKNEKKKGKKIPSRKGIWAQDFEQKQFVKRCFLCIFGVLFWVSWW